MSKPEVYWYDPNTGKAWPFDGHYGGDEELIKLVPVDTVVPLQKVLNVLLEIGVISSVSVQEKIKPGHGSCCTCQQCGRVYDDCVCTSNEIVEALMAAGYE